MLYFDTSFIAPLILPETTSDQIENFVNLSQHKILAISHWTRTEFASLIARHVRMNALDKNQAEKAIITFEELLRNSFEIIAPTVADFNLASSFIKKYETNLRAGDALHLSIAHNHNANHFYTLDKKLIKAAKLLNIPASGIHLQHDF